MRTTERSGLMEDEQDRSDRLTHRRVVIGAFIFAITFSILAFALLFIWSDGLKGQLQSSLKHAKAAHSSHISPEATYIRRETKPA
mmetsp:Transcript_42226/g.86329  ORF Transcript_42226/g.86329 Transcript_42226/m.86329 type:complete len:85 (-) Transcript_42226:61-315(-)